MDNILITICGRGGSQGVPGKNIRQLNGIPLIGYTIIIAKEFAKKYNADIGLSTDSKEIIDVAKQFGLVTKYLRPSNLATSTAGKVEVIRELKVYEESLRSKNYDFVLDLDISSPLRTLKDLEKAFDMLKNNEDSLNIFSVNPSNRNPYFNMVEKNSDGFYQVVKPLESILSRQKAPEVFDMNASFYIFKRQFFLLNYTKSTTDKSLAFVMDHICFDIDHPIDFLIMEFLLTNNYFKFDN